MRLRSTSLWAGIISGGISQFQDTKAYRKGHLNGSEYAAHTTKNVVGAVGIMAGLEYGAVLGSSLMPGIGTIAGTIIGGFLGDRLGSTIGLQAGNMLFNNGGSRDLLAAPSPALTQPEQPFGVSETTHQQQMIQ